MALGYLKNRLEDGNAIILKTKSHEKNLPDRFYIVCARW
jgi:hypothetical protein